MKIKNSYITLQSKLTTVSRLTQHFKGNSSFFFSFLMLLTFVNSYSQTTIIVEPGPIVHDDLGGVVVDNYAIDISDCTSIQYEVTYEFSLPWEGTGNMEYCDELQPSGSGLVCFTTGTPCACDPMTPLAGSCAGCWDFMWMQLLIDGSVVDGNLIGGSGTTDADQMGTYISPIICVEGETDGEIIITNQNWASNETNTYQDVMLICWEGVPDITTNSPICDGANLNLDGTAIDPSVIASWDWANSGGGNIDDPSSQVTFATDAEDGEVYTLEVTDVNGCTDSAEITASVSPAFDVTFTTDSGGDVLICEGDCALEDYIIELDASGGTGPFNVVFGGIPIPIPVILPSLPTYIQLCEGPLDVDISSDPVVISMPALFWSFSSTITIESIVDANNCNGNIIGGTLNLSIQPQPFIQDPAQPDPICLSGSSNNIDLTVYDTEILDGGSGEVIWLTDPNDVMSTVSTPTSYDIVNNNPVWAVVFEDPCYSDVVELNIDAILRPEITIVEPHYYICGKALELPQFSDLVVIDNQNQPMYFLDQALTDGPYLPGALVNALYGDSYIYIYDSSAPNCDDAAEILVTALLEPEIIFPSNLNACGTIQLPEPDVDNDNGMSYEYNTLPDGSGVSYFEGDEFDATSGIDILYLLVQNDGPIFCTDTAHIKLTYLGGTSYSANVPTQACDTLFLPPITPPSPTVGYFTSTSGGQRFQAGDTITYSSANAGMNPIDTLYLYDPSQSGACATVDTIVFDIAYTPILDIPFQPRFCEQGFLPPASANNPNLQYASDRNYTNILNPALPISASTQVFFRDSVAFINGGACYAMDSFFLEIIAEPYAGRDSSITLCMGYTGTFNLMEVLANPDIGGRFTSIGNIIDLDLSDSTAVDLGIIAPGDYEVVYSIEKQGCPITNSTFSFTVLDGLVAGTDGIITTCEMSVDNYDLLDLFDITEMGGTWTGSLGLPIVTDPTAYNLENVSVGSYALSYTLESTNSEALCSPATVDIQIIVEERSSAGDDQELTICKGQTIDISSLLTANADGGGTFTQDGFPVTDPTQWTPASLNDVVEVQYVLELNATNCLSDTAFITVNLSDNLSAGIPASNNIACENVEINLTDYLEGETPGGGFFLSSDLSTAISENFTPTTITDLTYIIPGAPGCDPDTTAFSVDIVTSPVLSSFLSANEICFDDEDCIHLEIQSNMTGSLGFEIHGGPLLSELTGFERTITSGTNTITFCPSLNFSTTGLVADTFFMGQGPVVEIETKQIRNTEYDCQSVDIALRETILINEDYQLAIDTILCPGASFLFGGQEYFASTSIMEARSNGCDSIIYIDIKNHIAVPNIIEAELCEGQSYDDITGFSFNKNIDTTIILTNGSTFGCDSILNVILRFEDVAVGRQNLDLCFGETITVDGVVFDANNTMEEVPAPVQSVFGCDSATLVSINFYNEGIPGDFSITICPDEDFPVGDKVYNINNFSGTSLLQGEAAGGCDSMVNVQLSFFPAAYDFDMDLCANDSIQIGDDFYHADNLIGTSSTGVLTADGCDSIVNVSLTLINLDERNFSPELCEDRDFVINGKTYNFSNPVGTEYIPNVTGCDSIYRINLIERSSAETFLDIDLCMDMDTIINGVTYNSAKDMGSSVLQNSFGCDSTVNVMLIIGEPQVDFISEICPGKSEGSLTITDVQGLNLPIELSIGGINTQIISAFPFETNLPEGNYTLLLNDGNCSLAQSFEISQSIAPSLEIQADTISDQIFQLSVISDIIISEYLWSTNAFLDCYDCANPIATLTSEEEITLTVSSNEGCGYLTNITLSPVEEPAAIDTLNKVYIPNSISYNDPSNDVFYVMSNDENLMVKELSIYDRWGNLVFVNKNFLANDPTFGWDGRREGVEIEQGVYIYLIELETLTQGDTFYTGDLTVIR